MQCLPATYAVCSFAVACHEWKRKFQSTHVNGLRNEVCELVGDLLQEKSQQYIILWAEKVMPMDPDFKLFVYAKIDILLRNMYNIFLLNFTCTQFASHQPELS